MRVRLTEVNAHPHGRLQSALEGMPVETITTALATTADLIGENDLLTMTAWVTLFGIWIAACLTHWLVDRPEREPGTNARMTDMRPAQ